VTGILFGYFIRSDIRFIWNGQGIAARDNFYVIQSKIDSEILFALLNNFFTYYQLEMLGKKYGAGLLKIQRYDIETLLFPDYHLFSAVDINDIRQIAHELIETSNPMCVQEITQIIGKYCEISGDEMKTMYDTVKKRRLEGSAWR
jgi:hypothetical protein